MEGIQHNDTVIQLVDFMPEIDNAPKTKVKVVQLVDFVRELDKEPAENLFQEELNAARDILQLKVSEDESSLQDVPPTHGIFLPFVSIGPACIGKSTMLNIIIKKLVEERYIDTTSSFFDTQPGQDNVTTGIQACLIRYSHMKPKVQERLSKNYLRKYRPRNPRNST